MAEQTELNFDSIVPLYAQITEKLELDIKSGQFSRTGRLPTESELSDLYQVSRITIRRAVDDLVAKGLVEKKQGKGTFICAPKLTRNFNSGPVSFSEMCAANGLTAHAKLLEAGISIPENTAVQDALGLKDQESAVRIRRLRFAGDTPVVLEDNFFPLEYSYLLSIDLEKDSIYRYLREEKGIELKSTDIHIHIVRASTKLAKLLQVPRNAPQLEMRGRVVTLDGRTVHTSYQVGYGENFEFTVR